MGTYVTQTQQKVDTLNQTYKNNGDDASPATSDQSGNVLYTIK